jgi:hypothetical protein
MQGLRARICALAAQQLRAPLPAGKGKVVDRGEPRQLLSSLHSKVFEDQGSSRACSFHSSRHKVNARTAEAAATAARFAAAVGGHRCCMSCSRHLYGTSVDCGTLPGPAGPAKTGQLSTEVVTGVAIKKGESDPPILPDSEYPAWLFELMKPEPSVAELERMYQQEGLQLYQVR